MNLFEGLTDNEKSAMRDYISAYAESENGLLTDLETIMEPWNNAKQFLYRVLGNGLRIEKEVEYQRPQEELERSIERLINFWDSPYRQFRETFYEKLKAAILNNNDLAELREKYGEVPTFYYANLIENLSRVGALAKNEYYMGWEFEQRGITRMDLKISADKKISFEEGMRPMRVIGKIVKEIAPELQNTYEQFRIAVSQITNQRCLKGYLGLSIHPLDYMTMSDNNSGWSSCMSWQEHGCYRSGTVEMMNSPMVVVGYLRGDKDMELNCGNTTMNWTNKKWRQLFIVDEHILTSVKSYPYYNESLEFECLSWLRNLAITNGGMTYSDVRHTFSSCSFNNRIFFRTNAMYNDFGTTDSHCYLADETYADSNGSYQGAVYINYSGVRECMSCGTIHGYFESAEEPESALCCDNCWEGDRDINYCVCCGDALYEDEICWHDYEPYCEACFAKYFVEDAITHRWIDRDDTIKIHFPKIIYRQWSFETKDYLPDTFDWSTSTTLFIWDRSDSLENTEYSSNGSWIGFTLHGVHFTYDETTDEYICDKAEMYETEYDKLLRSSAELSF